MSYGLLMALGMGLGVSVGWYFAPRTRLSRQQFLDLAFVSLLAGFFGARLLDVFTDRAFYLDLCLRPEALIPSGSSCKVSACHPIQECVQGVCMTRGDCLAVFKPWLGGMTYYGGVILGLAAAIVWVAVKKLPAAAALDLLALGQPLGHSIGRVGCLFGGCCYGRHLEGGGLYPVQIIEAAGELAIFAFLVVRFLRGTCTRTTEAGVLPLYLVLYGVLRFSTEFLRGDRARGYLVELSLPRLENLVGDPSAGPLMLSLSQGISLTAIVVGIIWLFRRRRRERISCP